MMPAMNVTHVVTRKVAAAAPGTPVPELAKLLIQRRLSAMPVTDPVGHVLGVVSEGDLMQRPEIGTERHLPWWFRAFSAPQSFAARFVRSHRPWRETLFGGVTREVVGASLLPVLLAH